MKFGYACIPLMIPFKTTRKFQLKSFNEDLLIRYIKDNLNDLLNILKYNLNNNIYMFRISSDIIPFGSHKVNTFNWQEYFKNELFNIGSFIKKNHMRVSMHPGQYTVLNSPSQEVVCQSIRDLEYHCNFLDSLGLDSTHKIILHVGGIYDNKSKSIERFNKNYMSLNKNIKSRLVIENDERNYSLTDIYKISNHSSIPIIFDNLHYYCYNSCPYSLDDCLKLASSTWNKIDGPFKVHYSQQDLLKKLGAHSLTININEFMEYFKVFFKYSGDIMLEVKDKNISALKVINALNDNNNFDELSKEVKKYKLFLNERCHLGYEKAKDLIEYKTSFLELYNFIDSLIYKEQNESLFLKTLCNTFSAYENKFNSKEINHFNKLLKESQLVKAKEYLYKLSIRYNIIDLLESYYFLY